MRFLSAFFALFMISGVAMAEEWITRESPHAVKQTVDQLTAAIEGAGATVVAVVDHSAAAKKAGLELAPSTLVIFGNPKIGTPIMQDNIRAGLDLPIRVLVFEEGGKTMVGYLDPAVLQTRYGIKADNEAVKKMTGALMKLTDAAIK
ncbi:MAG: DUF302 domain-containing protein [Rhizobiales bacterium]|nr:DUF302 domain-containing protein [Hyphomicrobiales bacterium]